MPLLCPRAVRAGRPQSRDFFLCRDFQLNATVDLMDHIPPSAFVE